MIELWAALVDRHDHQLVSLGKAAFHVVSRAPGPVTHRCETVRRLLGQYCGGAGANGYFATSGA
ncbi:hypothetical protein [Nonomuraea bangladeshensis]|uniref:hypothetical protein n=1 Tax=Nonomuraea bangladeshensis TaxID=404385 RepID=UPI0031D1D2ED